MNYYVPSVFETFNARHLTPDQVARTFVPPVEIFSELVTRNHHIVMGPRGSGKTTLLKMLTLPALATWDIVDYNTVIPLTDFIGIFVPADRGWHVQLKGADQSKGEGVSVGRVAFTTHVLSSFVQTLRDIHLLQGRANSPMVHLPRVLDADGEAAFVEETVQVWGLRPAIRSLGGLSVALKARLVQLGSLRESVSRAADPEGYLLEHAPFADLNFRDCLSHAIELYGVLTGDSRHAWAFLFDEFEVAPSHIQRDVLSSLRGESDTRILYKVALAPYNRKFLRNVSDISASPGNDFKVIDLWYPEKTRAYDFAEQLIRRMLSDQEIEPGSVRQFFGPSEFGFPEADDVRPYDEDGKVLKSFIKLARIDPSFEAHLHAKRINLATVGQMTEVERAEKVRKLRSIVITREYFLRYDKDIPIKARGRSRKIRKLYTGYPTILALCEGNPRLLIGIATPLLRKLKRLRMGHGSRSVDKPSQAAQVKLAANSFRSLLKTIPYRQENDTGQRGLLRLLDTIGEFFHRKCVLEDFSPQPPLSFTVDSSTDGGTLTALGRALNAGAIVYVPDPGADPILTSLLGKRFRLCYLLAAYYKLPIMLNTSVALSSIIGRGTGVRPRTKRTASQQADLFAKRGIRGND